MTLAPALPGQVQNGEAARSYARIADVLDLPNLIQIQLKSFRWFQEEGLKELFEEINPIQDFTGNKMELRFNEYQFGEPKYSEEECRQRDMTFAAPLRVIVHLMI
jgi:DNA-directed RNA polymerase subunit beta